MTGEQSEIRTANVHDHLMDDLPDATALSEDVGDQYLANVGSVTTWAPTALREYMDNGGFGTNVPQRNLARWLTI